MRVIFSFLMIMLCIGAAAQSKKKEKAEEPTEAFFPQQEQTPKNSKKSTKETYDARDESYARLERNWKAREKREKKFTRNMARDYSIAPYFGHKRPPKIRPVGKRKVCKVCGLTH